MNLSKIIVENNILLRRIAEKLGIPENEWKLPLSAKGARLADTVDMLRDLGYSKDETAEILGVSETTVSRHRRQNKAKAEEELIDFD